MIGWQSIGYAVLLGALDEDNRAGELKQPATLGFCAMQTYASP